MSAGPNRIDFEGSPGDQTSEDDGLRTERRENYRPLSTPLVKLTAAQPFSAIPASADGIVAEETSGTGAGCVTPLLSNSRFARPLCGCLGASAMWSGSAPSRCRGHLP